MYEYIRHKGSLTTGTYSVIPAVDNLLIRPNEVGVEEQYVL
jgi:hypothetical protein